MTRTFGITRNIGQTRDLTYYTDTVNRDGLFDLSYYIDYLIKDMKNPYW